MENKTTAVVAKAFLWKEKKNSSKSTYQQSVIENRTACKVIRLIHKLANAEELCFGVFSHFNRLRITNIVNMQL